MEDKPKTKGKKVKFFMWASQGQHDPRAQYGAYVYNCGQVGAVFGLLTGIILPLIKKEPRALIGLIPSGIMIGLLFGMGVGTLIDSLANWIYKTKDCRRETKLRGISVLEVKREMPIFGVKQRISLERGDCVRYSIKRVSNKSPLKFQFLQRNEKEGAQFPNGYLLITEGGEIPSDLEIQLKKTALEFNEEFFEFEGTSEEVAVFWEEWGGSEEVKRLNKYLQALARAY